MINVRAYIDDVTKGLGDLVREHIPRATQQTLNRAAATVQSTTKSELARVMNLRVKGVLNGIVVLHKSAKLNLEATVTTSDRKGIGLEESKSTIVRVTTRGKGTSKRKVNKVIYKGKTLEGAFRIEQIGGLKRGIFKKGEGKYATGNRKVLRTFAYPATQELIHAKVDEVQDRIGAERFGIEFDRALANSLRKARF